MKISLIIPPSSTRVRWGKFKDVIQPYLPLGLAYLAAAMEKERHRVQVIDAPAFGYKFNDLEMAIRDFCPHIVGQQTVYSNLEECFRVARIAKSIDSKIKVVLGGPHSTIYPDICIKEKEVDFIICGEGEIVMKELLKSLENGADFSKVSGLIWKDGERVVKNNQQSFITDLDVLPLPARHLFPIKKYRASSHLRGERVLSMIASRGCPYRCMFCWVSHSFGKRIRYRSPARVVEEMILLKEEYGADSIRFWDDSITANRKWIDAFCNILIENQLNIPWFCLSRVNLIDMDLLEKMKEAGCCQIFYGIESGVQRILDILKKEITLEQARNAVQLTKRAGIETTCSYMLGLPGESEKDAEQTINFAIELDSDYVQFNLIIPHMSGKEFCDLAMNYGTILDDVDHATFFDRPVYLPHGRTSEELRKTIKKAFKRYYIRPSYIVRRLRTLNGLPLKKYLLLLWTGLKVLFWR